MKTGACWLAILGAALFGPSSFASDAVPGDEWERISPEQAGLNSARLREARDYALSGGGSGLIVRGGRVVMAWGDAEARYDLKSTSKSIGATALALAIGDEKVSLDDLASKHHPRFGIPPESNADTGWLGRITLKHLATQTAGFEKPGGYTRLVFEPGSKWLYSDGGPNWLAECLTLVYRMDLEEFLFDRVFRPIGIQRNDLRWRNNAYRPHEIEGIPRREFGSGVHANVDAMARIGLLYLREGRWNGRQILPADYVRTLRAPLPEMKGLPEHDPGAHGNASEHYSLLWWNNADGALSGVPKDTFWSWGLYDSLIVVMPSLDIVAARAGKSWEREGDGHYDVLKPFFEPLVKAALENRPADSSSIRWPGAPYPPSPVIQNVRWAPKDEIVRLAKGSDNWPNTWADDGLLYTAYGDGWGFEPKVPEKLSLGLARVSGMPPRLHGANIRSPSAEQKGQGSAGIKASGMLMVDGVLYLFARNAGNARLAWSEDHGQNWKWADWRFTKSFGCPTFLNFGQDYEGARDGFVYVYSHDSESAYQPADRMVLARAPKGRLRERAAYEFLKAVRKGNPVWTDAVEERGAVFTHSPRRCYRSGVTFNPALRRYLWCQIIPGEDTRFQGGFGIYDAPTPWGPWTTVYFSEEWDVGPGETSSLPGPWMSSDGKTAHLLFSGDDAFSVRRAEFVLAELPVEGSDPKQLSASGLSIEDGQWRWNGEVTYPGAPAEGLLMNVRMVNSVFEDRHRPEFDAEANARAFVARIPEYVEHGVRAFTIGLQGGMPGYEGALNSAFEPDGSLRASYMERVRRVIDACGKSGASVILGCFYQRQDQVLRDEEAVRTALRNVARWINESGFRNVVLEVANEYDHGGFDHEIIRSSEGQAGLIRLAKAANPGLLVSASGLGHGRIDRAVAEASDFILIHFNGTSLDQIPDRIRALEHYGKPIVCNEDDKTGREASQAAELCVANGASYGLMLKDVNQYQPFEFKGAADDPIVYRTFRRLTSK